MATILFGSISTIADTSELQRAAFNDAFRKHGLDWEWSAEDYRSMLDSSGGSGRIAQYAESRGESVDADAVHATKSELFQQAMSDGEVSARAGVAETIRQAKEQGLTVGLVTTTSPQNVDAMFAALDPEISRNDFDVVLDTGQVQQPKPDPAAYSAALERLGVSASDCIAIEDNVDGVSAAQAAGITCLAFPNENTAGHDFSAAAEVVDHVDLDALRAHLSSD